MLASPYLSRLQSATEGLIEKLREIEELLDLWASCQSKVRTDCLSFPPFFDYTW
mgnify:CR=1 FL=1